MKLTNQWNRFIYWCWSPVYDLIVGGLFAPGRRRAMELLVLRPGERVLLVGVGTGDDLPLLPAGVRALGIDLSPAMLAQARKKLPIAGCDVELREGDAQALTVEPGSFDAAVLHLILSVVPDGGACFRETMRALKPGGRAVLFDKFLPDSGRLGFGRRLLNLVTTLGGTDINRRLDTILDGAGARIRQQEPSLLGGTYRIVLVDKPKL